MRRNGTIFQSPSPAGHVDILRALEFAHSRRIIHRDVKPANILIAYQNEGKLSDFGLAIPAAVVPEALGICVMHVEAPGISGSESP
jgi:serine/threonine protein kinase